LATPPNVYSRKSYQLQGGFAPLTSHQGLCPLDPRWGLRPQTPVIGSRSRARHENPNPPFTNPAYIPGLCRLSLKAKVRTAQCQM